MVGRMIRFAVACAAVTWGSVAAANTVDAVVQSCVQTTGAPGAFVVQVGDGAPQVSPGIGATAAGAAVVNDCLLDRYQVQFAAVQRGSVAPTDVQADAIAECRRIRNRRVATTVAIAAGLAVGVDTTAAAATAAAGAGYTSWRAGRTYRDCVADASVPQAQSGIALIRNCGRGSNVFQGGSAYCRD